jgi:23S rRNA (uracil1939-C5)-methyltransferase
MQPIETVTIEKIIHGGAGLARTDRGAVLVPGVLPEETVSVVSAGRRQGMEVMLVERILEPSPDRRSPPCEYFGICGGCDWLCIEYTRQVELKKAVFLESMERIGRLKKVTQPEIVTAAEFGYRRRAQLKLDAQHNAGFFKRGTNDVVKIVSCPLLTERLNDLLKALNGNPSPVRGAITNLPVIDGDHTAASVPVLDGHTCKVTDISCGTFTFEVTGTSFFQGNRYLLEKLGRWGTAWCSGDSLLDLYGGTGFFSLMFADRVTQGWLVEAEKKMVTQANDNFRKNGVTHITAIAASAENVEQCLPRVPSTVIIDPPRPGLTGKVREAMARIAPEVLIYVSCNCSTQARDCGFFCNRAGYRIAATVLFDLYPGTHHIESIVVLTK